MTPAPARRRQPGFLVAAAILAFSAVYLNVAVSRLQLHFKKLPVPPARELAGIPARLGPWAQVSKDEPLGRETQEMLGTPLYVFRDYVDTRLLSPTELAAFDGLDSVQRAELAHRVQLERPDAVINCAVTYYTGLVDTVAHIPERCYVANGFLPGGHETLTLPLGAGFAGNDGGHDLDAEFISFTDPTETAGGGVNRVMYCFFVNGRWESDSIGVRERLQDLRATHGFYSKVELRMTLADHDRCVARMTDFLSAGLPQISRCYPDWAAVEGRGR